MASINFVAWRYHSDNGNVYVRRADQRMVAQNGTAVPPQVGVGGGSAAGLTPYAEMPRNLKPRVALVKEPNQPFKARVVIYDVGEFNALVTGESTINVFDRQGVSHTCVVLGKKGESPEGAIGA